MTIKFYPDAAASKWTHVEVSAIHDFGDCVEQCDEEDAHYWSVLLRQYSGGVRCIADLPTKRLAYQLAELIEKGLENSTIQIVISADSNIRINKT